jgi:cytochrome c
MKNPLSFNKIAAALLVALMLAWAVGKISRNVVSPVIPDKNAYVVDTGAAPAPAAGAPAAPAGPAPIGPLLASAKPEEGAKYAKVCATCHSFGKGEAAKMGPNLYGIIGSKHAHMAGFSYSSGMQALSDKTWDFAALNEFLFSPRNAVSGTKMSFAGIKSDSDRANVIAWLRTLSDNPVPLPK